MLQGNEEMDMCTLTTMAFDGLAGSHNRQRQEGIFARVDGTENVMLSELHSVHLPSGSSELLQVHIGLLGDL